MKKLIGFLLICSILLSLVGCGNPQFKSEEAMMEYMEGLWAHDYYNKGKVYYLFRDGKVYCVNQALFSESVDSVFEEYVEDNKFTELSELAFEDVKERSPLSTYVYGAEKTDVRTKPRKGEICADYERIHITDGEVTIRRYDEKKTQTMTKVSDASKSIEELMAGWFEEAKSEVQIPISNLIKSAEEYAEEFMKMHPEFGAPSISNGGLTLRKGNDTWVMYNINGVLGQDYHLFISDSVNTPMSKLVDYAAPFLEDFPGALSTAQILDLFEKEHTVSGGSCNMEKTVDGITYKIGQATSGKNTVIYITFPD